MIGEALEQVRRRVAVVVVDPDADGRDRRMEDVEELRCRGGAGAVVGHLEDVDASDAARQELAVFVLLEVAHQQEAVPGGLPQEHDRFVVDRLAVIERRRRDVGRRRPEHTKANVVELETVAGSKPSAPGITIGERLGPCDVARAAPGEPGLVRDTDPIAIEERREPGDMVLVGMRQDDRVNPSVPWRKPLVERDEQPPGIRPTVHEHSPAAAAVDQDRVALTHVEDDEVRDPPGSVGDRETECDRRAR